ncbi:glucose receptor git3 [Pyrenophora tritici-repentis]|nr:glucose receptor git3 [Pyrenophora tritici-repentis]
MPYDEPVLIPTLTGSLLSCVATACVLISYIVYAKQQQSFRHALVLNLSLAGRGPVKHVEFELTATLEFINSLNNSISGLYVLTHGKTSPGLACTVNGWVGQWSVQAADFSILAIAIITLLTITRTTYMPNTCLVKKILICASVWFIPTTTASIAAGLDQLKPVSGNWCWISGAEPELRYALGHAWRFSIMLATIGIYIYIWVYMGKHYKTLHLVSAGETYTHHSTVHHRQASQDDAVEQRSESQMELRQIHVEHQVDVDCTEGGPAQSPATDIESGGCQKCCTTVSVTSETDPYSKDTLENKLNVLSSGKHDTPPNDARTTQASNPSRVSSQSRNVEREIKRMLLLNAYPILYIILWMPGMLNRLVEASGHKSRALTIMQCSTQYIGLANAITYGLNKQVRKLVMKDVNRIFRKK